MKTLCGFAVALLLAGSLPTFAQQQGDPGTPPHSAEAGAATQNGSAEGSRSMVTGGVPHSSTPSGAAEDSSTASIERTEHSSMAQKSPKKARRASSTRN